MEMDDYLVVGHLCRDLLPDGGSTVGGTVAYSGRLAHALGYKTAVLTSTDEDYDLEQVLPGIQVHNVVSESATTFSNIYTPDGRVQIVHAVANPITTADIPAGWQDIPLVHLGPLVNRVDPEMIDSFPNSMVCLTPQGWMRRWHDDGRVFARQWEQAQYYLPKAAAVILSTEDLLDDEMLIQYRAWSKLLVITRGWDGCTVFQGDQIHHIPAPTVKEVEPTGAGDIFATAFFLRFRESGGDALAAGAYANVVAAQSVTQIGIEKKLIRIQEQLRASNYQI